MRSTTVCALCGFGALALFAALAGLMSDTALETAVLRGAVALGMVEAPEAVALRCFFGFVRLLCLDGEATECF